MQSRYIDEIFGAESEDKVSSARSQSEDEVFDAKSQSENKVFDAESK